MGSIVEMIIVFLAGAASILFMAWYFYSSSKKPGKCISCSTVQLDNIKEYFKKKQEASKDQAKNSII